MNKIIIAASASYLLAATALAHPGGHGEDEFVPVFDCSAMAGAYAMGAKRTATVTVEGGRVTIAVAPAGDDKATGTCVSPLIVDGINLPRALMTSNAALGAKFVAPDCCSVILKNDELSFDNGEVWSRRKPAK
jgi:hypothetical protein